MSPGGGDDVTHVPGARPHRAVGWGGLEGSLSAGAEMWGGEVGEEWPQEREEAPRRTERVSVSGKIGWELEVSVKPRSFGAEGYARPVEEEHGVCFENTRYLLTRHTTLIEDVEASTEEVHSVC